MVATVPTLPYDTEIDSLGESTQSASAVSMPDRFATEPEIAAAVGQLNAGEPVTALPRQDWSFQQAQAFNAKLDAFDQQAKAARAASEQAARDAAMLDQMSRVAKSTKDIEIALRTQDEIGFRNSVASGVPPVQALTRFPRAASSPLVALARASQPQEAKWVGAAGGAPGHFQLPGGGVTIPPSTEALSNRGEAILGPDGQPLGIGVPTGPRSRTLIREPAAGTLPQDVRSAITVLQRQLSDLDKAISDNKMLATPEMKAQVADWTRQRDAVQARLLELNPKASVSGGSPSKGGSVAVTGQGTREDPSRPTTKAQFDSMPLGTYFINPSDGKLRQKNK